MKTSRSSASLVRLLALPAAAVGFACSDSSTEPPPPPVTAEVTVDASQAPAYVRLGTPTAAVTVSDPATSSAWDLSLFATTVTANGGAAGPGDVAVYCVCQNASASAVEIQAMTPANQLAAFEQTIVANIPAAAEFRTDSLSPAIAGWYAGSPGPAMTPVVTRAWLLREGASPNVLLGKFHVTNIASATATAAGVITFEYALQPSPGAAFSATETATVDTRNGPVYFDLSTGAVSTSANWDLLFSGFGIRMNGGVSGPGTLSAVPDDGTPFAQITATYAATAPAQAFRRDAFSGVFASNPWYRYNVTGTDNQIWPTFNVYLVQRGGEVYKVQLTGYYGPTGASRQITLRTARLR